MKNRLGLLLTGGLVALGICLYSASPAAAKQICEIWEPEPTVVGCGESVDTPVAGLPVCAEIVLGSCGEILTHAKNFGFEYQSQSSSGGQTTYLLERDDEAVVIICELACLQYVGEIFY